MVNIYCSSLTLPKCAHLLPTCLLEAFDGWLMLLHLCLSLMESEWVNDEYCCSVIQAAQITVCWYWGAGMVSAVFHRRFLDAEGLLRVREHLSPCREVSSSSHRELAWTYKTIGTSVWCLCRSGCIKLRKRMGIQHVLLSLPPTHSVLY